MDPNTPLSRLSVLATILRRCWPHLVEDWLRDIAVTENR